jgi:hypothetical protein
LAGNLTRTNLYYILDPAANTNPPALTLLWPQNGTSVSGSNFTLRGTVNDPFATVTAQIVDDGITNGGMGEVEQNENFWIENLPLGAGTNYVTLTATNAAGYGVATNFTIIQSSVVLAVTSITYGANSAVAQVFGTVDPWTSPVYVNGVEATLVGNNGSFPTIWTANNVPSNPNGTVTFSVSAGVQQETQVETNIPGFSGIRPTSFKYNFTYQYQDLAWTALPAGAPELFTLTINEDATANWQFGSSGNESEDGCDTTQDSGSSEPYPYYSAPYSVQNYYAYRCTWGANNVGTYSSSYTTNCGEVSWQPEGTTNNGLWDPSEIPSGVIANAVESTTVVDVDGIFSTDVSTSWQCNAQSVSTLYTGGKSDSPQQNLWIIHAWVQEGLYNPPLGDGMGIPSLPYSPPGQISVAGQALDTNGSAYLALANNAEVDVTAHASGSAYYFANSATEYTPQILANGIPLDPVKTNATFCVGKQLTFTLAFSAPLPSYLTNIVYNWTLSGQCVNAVTNNPGGCPVYYINSSLLNSSNAKCWCYGSSMQTVSVGADLILPNGKSIGLAAIGKFAMYRPTIDMNQIQEPRYFTLTPAFAGGATVELGSSGSTAAGEMAYTVEISSDVPGKVEITQTCPLTQVDIISLTGDAMEPRTTRGLWPCRVTFQM